ncbi:hypothetical protein HLB44_01565 [Aquincola sp. S2]|uniref:DUF4071 domain-containing protein n=1 Tax=Pseudaquabacterium terrae TaxID=2732868 RepID=A0ABX2EA18_9BURK|nr:tetratricopeptide repeat-containing protein [Aquabacterium terrae]NRF65663.1 hypothetical protein [Aquabacterium terrae]
MNCFVVRGFGVKRDSDGCEIDFDRIHRELIEPALQKCGIAGGTTTQVVEPGNIQEDMFRLLLQADLVVCDITVHNANVFYELGVRHALRKKHTVLIKGSPSADKTPFDIGGNRYLAYAVAQPGAQVDALVAAIEAARSGYRETDSPIFLMLPRLPEADTSVVTIVPLDFVEEVQQAEASRDKGWLRLLAEDVRGESFEWEGSKLIGRAQWSVTDFEGARATWEAVRKRSPLDLDANLALANVYERLYKRELDPVLLEQSNQAIQKVLDRQNLMPKQRSEALALEGRNLKTLWRLKFDPLETLDQRRERALDIQLKQSFEAYRDAFNIDLNNFFPGIAAYQMGRILQSIADSPRFQNLFTLGNRKLAAERYREDLGGQLTALEHVVRASIERALTPGASDSETATWAAISAADLLFLTEGDEADAGASATVQAYEAAVPRSGFYWNAARGQLKLFEQLGLRGAMANAVIERLDGPPATGGTRKPRLVVFSGHTVDRGDAIRPRFPKGREDLARTLIVDGLRKLKADGEPLVVLVSAAPGADILALEACAAEGIDTWLCLPMEKDAVAREVFSHYDDTWRNRFLALWAAHAKGRRLVLQRGAGLPRWLARRETLTPWERGSRWMMHLAESWDCERRTLLALWDRNEQDGSTAGTAQMVRLARIGAFEISTIDATPLASP